MLLSVYQNFIKIQNKSKYFDINRECENIFCEVLNSIYGLMLANLNIGSNYPAIDLGDEEAEVCFQITSNSNVSKIQHTIDLYKKHDLDKKYSELNILILGKKNKYSKQFPQYVTIMDFCDLGDIVSQCKSKDVLLEVQNILHCELASRNLIANDKSLLRNIEQINIKYGTNYFNGFFTGINEVNSEDTDDVNCFAKQLADLDIKLREVIYAATQKPVFPHSHRNYNEGIVFNYNNLAMRLKDRDEVFNRLRQLKDFGYLREYDNESPDLLELCFPNRGGDYDMLEEVYKYCRKTKKDLSMVLLYLDFTILD